MYSFKNEMVEIVDEIEEVADVAFVFRFNSFGVIVPFAEFFLIIELHYDLIVSVSVPSSSNPKTSYIIKISKKSKSNFDQYFLNLRCFIDLTLSKKAPFPELSDIDQITPNFDNKARF